MKFAKIKQSSVALMGIIVVSKLVGMLRDIVLANCFGTTNISDAYLIAASVPTLLFYFIGHSLSTAYIPMYNKVKAEKGEIEAQRFSNNLLNIAMVLSTVIVAVLLAVPEVVVKVFAAGFDGPTTQIAVRMIRISVPSIYFMCIVNICGGYLQANKNFLAPAAISLPRNAVIVGAIVLAASFGIDWLGWGLLAAYAVEFLFLLPFVAAKGYRYRPIIQLREENIRQTMYIVAPILLGVCVSQVNKIVDRSMASMVVEGGISALTYASVINNAIQEILVTGIITILFANCSELVAKNEHDQVKRKLHDTLGAMIFLLIPASVGVIILAEPIVRVLLCRGEFDKNSLAMTMGSLRCYTVGLLFLAIRDALIKVFYAYKETRTTTFVSITAIIGNIIMNLVLGRIMGIRGLALATSLTAVFSCVTLYVLLRRKIGDYGFGKTKTILMKSVLGCVPMGFTAYYVNWYLSLQMAGIAAALVAVLFACLAYFAAELLLRNEPIMFLLQKWKEP